MDLRQLLSTFVLIALLAAAPAARAELADLQGLPVQLSSGCAACHSGAGVSANFVPAAVASQLNQFGADWLSFGRVWGPDMAQTDSDGDGCKNGMEISDPNGEWVFGDDYLSDPASLPWDPTQAGDCILPVDETSFGVLKSLFSEE